eukprot:CCRYP_019960-RA/>CCRYP_019960-RA protein AED:0.16 eAED:0.06 QI:0/1/0/1/1/1/2/0/799
MEYATLPHLGFTRGAVNIPVRLKSCDDSSKDHVVAMTYTDEEGQYYFNISANEDGFYYNDELREYCYYLQVDVSQYSLSPYVTSGVATPMTTNQVYPDSGRSEEAIVQPGDEVVWNVGIAGKSSSFVQEAFDAAEEITFTPATSTEAVFISTQSTHYPNSSFSFNGTDDDAMYLIENLDNHTMLDNIADNQTSLNVDTNAQLTTSTTIATGFTASVDNVTTDPTQSIFMDSLDKVDRSTTQATESVGNVDNVTVDQTESIFNYDNIASDVSPSVAPIFMPTKLPTSSFWTNNQLPTSDTNPSSTLSTILSEVSSTAANGTSPTVSQTSTSVFSGEEEATAEEAHSTQDAKDQEGGGNGSMSSVSSVSPTENGYSSQTAASPNATYIADITIHDSAHTNTTKSTNDTNNTSNFKPIVSPTHKPTLCVGFELHVQAIVRVELDSIGSKLDDDSRSLLESVCGSFLGDQLSIATPPISDVGCMVVDESYEDQSLGRALRGDYTRVLSQVYIADVNVTGTAMSTKLYQTSESTRFKELCVGTFTVQGIYFVKALQEAEQNSGSNDAVFHSVQNARGVMTYDASQASQAGEQIDDPSNPDAGRLSSSVLAVIAASSVFCLMGLLMFIVIRTLDTRRHKCTDKGEKSGSANSGKARKFAEVQNYNFFTLSPANSSASGGTVVTPVSIRSNATEVEVNIIPPSFSGRKEGSGGQSKRSVMLNTRVRRHLMAPPGKLGILVADTPGCGPAIHTIREGSPMEGLIFVSDIIIAINDINTRNFTAAQITQIMKETIHQERAITVLSSVR